MKAAIGSERAASLATCCSLESQSRNTQEKLPFQSWSAPPTNNLLLPTSLSAEFSLSCALWKRKQPRYADPFTMVFFRLDWNPIANSRLAHDDHFAQPALSLSGIVDVMTGQHWHSKNHSPAVAVADFVDSVVDSSR